MRLFTAIVPPAWVVDELDAFLAPRRDAPGPWRWTRPESWHLTTSFLPSVAPADVWALVEELAGAASRTPAFDVALGGAGSFPAPYAAKVLWVGVPVGSDALTTLARRGRTAAERTGVSTGGGRFVPHLTVARSTGPVEATKWLRVLDAAPTLAWRATELALVESHLHDRGNRYEVLERFELT